MNLLVLLDVIVAFDTMDVGILLECKELLCGGFTPTSKVGFTVWTAAKPLCIWPTGSGNIPFCSPYCLASI